MGLEHCVIQHTEDQRGLYGHVVALSGTNGIQNKAALEYISPSSGLNAYQAFFPPTLSVVTIRDFKSSHISAS